jgi:hypothetical protein
MAIPVDCTCGQAFQVGDDLAGKRIKCPSCQAVLTVQGPAADFDEDRDKESARQRRGGAARQGSSRVLLWVGLAGGAVLLGLCCLGGVGVGAWFLFGGPPPEKTLIGKWANENNGFAAANEVMEFREDGTYSKKGGILDNTGKWRITAKNGNTLDIRIDNDAPGEGVNRFSNEIMTLRIDDKNHLSQIPRAGIARQPVRWIRVQ